MLICVITRAVQLASPNALHVGPVHNITNPAERNKQPSNVNEDRKGPARVDAITLVGVGQQDDINVSCPQSETLAYDRWIHNRDDGRLFRHESNFPDDLDASGIREYLAALHR